MRVLAQLGAALAALVICLPASAEEITVAEVTKPEASPSQPRVLNRDPVAAEPAAPAASFKADARAAAPAVLPPAALAPAPAIPAAAPVEPATTPAAAAPAAAAVPAAADPGEKIIGKTVAPAPKPQPSVVISVSLTDQRMTVTEGGAVKHTWPVSTGRAGYYTPTGNFRPQWMARMWRSRKYDNAPMPHSIFFTGGFAIHATYSVGMLGRPASHGCVRLSPTNAATLFKIVQTHGMDRTKIVLHGAPPRSAPEVARREVRRDPRVATYRPITQPARYVQQQQQQPSAFAKLFGGDEAPRRVAYVLQPQRSARPVYGYTQNGRVVRIR